VDGDAIESKLHPAKSLIHPEFAILLGIPASLGENP
jgi:hypothetical protein